MLRTKGEKQIWFYGKEQNKNLEELERRFTSGPILVQFYRERKMVIEIDGSNFALGCILSRYLQKRVNLVAFYSRKFHNAEEN